MHDQLTHLARLSERPNVLVEIVPASTGANAGLSGGFQLASCDVAPDMLNMSGVENVTAESPSLLRRATVVFDLVRSSTAGSVRPTGIGRCQPTNWLKRSRPPRGPACLREPASGQPQTAPP